MEAGRCASCFFPMTASRFQTTRPDVIRGMLDRSRKLASPSPDRGCCATTIAECSGEPVFAILRTRPEMTTMAGSAVGASVSEANVAVISARYLPAFQTRHPPSRGSIHTSEEDAHASLKRRPLLSLFHAAEAALERKARIGC